MKNLITAIGFVSFGKNYGEISTGSLGISVNTAKKGEDAIWKYLNVRVEAKLSEVDFTKLENKRLQISGFISGDVFTPKDLDKEIVKLKLVNCRVKELKKGEKGETSVEMETRVSYLREFGTNGIGGSCSRSFKHKDTYKFVNFSFSGNREKLALNDGDIVEVKGYLSADFFVPKGSKKEVAMPKIVILEATKIEKSEGSENPTSNDEVPKTTDEKPNTNVPEIEIDEDEIPF